MYEQRKYLLFHQMALHLSWAPIYIYSTKLDLCLVGTVWRGWRDVSATMCDVMTFSWKMNFLKRNILYLLKFPRGQFTRLVRLTGWLWKVGELLWELLGVGWLREYWWVLFSQFSSPFGLSGGERSTKVELSWQEFCLKRNKWAWWMNK